MIISLFPNNVLIKDYELSNEWTNNVTATTKAVFAAALAEKNDYAVTGNNDIGLFTEENLKNCPELEELRQIFIDGFYELASSFSTNRLTKEMISDNIRKEFGRLPFMKKGDYKGVHNHDSMVDAFGIFYLTDIDNEKHGGNLILHDPAFHGIFDFHEPRTYSIATKKNRLVICPNHIWHEVKQYLGDDERITVVINLNVVPLNNSK